jgi:selenocysteine lyase/cysteine desulfurase
MIPDDPTTGLIDLNELERIARRYANHPALKIGSFSAASNVTGVLTDTDSVSYILHKYGFYAFWDYASCAPYVQLDMNPRDPSNPQREKLTYKDAIFFSGHKFIGGPNTPGVLIVKSHVINNKSKVPSRPGGGTVLFVTKDDHSYLDDTIEREEGGTPDILGSIRLGLAMKLKMDVGVHEIERRERRNAEMVWNHPKIMRNPDIVVLGPGGDVDRLPIFGFMVRAQDGRFLHYNFVSALLNDLFGIQSRGGCSCAGPYGVRLLGISDENVQQLKVALGTHQQEIVKPGYTRVSFPYFMEEEEVEYIMDAVVFVAEHGYKFLRDYNFNLNTGEWKHKSYASTTTATHETPLFIGQKLLTDVSWFPLSSKVAKNPDADTDNTTTTLTLDTPEQIQLYRQENLSRAYTLAYTLPALQTTSSPSSSSSSFCHVETTSTSTQPSDNLKNVSVDPASQSTLNKLRTSGLRWFLLPFDLLPTSSAPEYITQNYNPSLIQPPSNTSKQNLIHPHTYTNSSRNFNNCESCLLHPTPTTLFTPSPTTSFSRLSTETHPETATIQNFHLAVPEHHHHHQKHTEISSIKKTNIHKQHSEHTTWHKETYYSKTLKVPSWLLPSGKRNRVFTIYT